MNSSSTVHTPTPSSPQQLATVARPASSASPKTSKRTRRASATSQVVRSILRLDARQTRRSRVVYKFKAGDLEPFFHMPQREAAKLLGVAPITIKRACKRCGIRWPYRDAKLKLIQDARMRDHARIQAATALTSLVSAAARAFARLPFLCMEANALAVSRE